jgi:hypothetical protein
MRKLCAKMVTAWTQVRGILAVVWKFSFDLSSSPQGRF